ncbi:hypothetical protein GWK47_026803 [Chionoecetes opilio]|uniref:Uncharacterized protein n=1 Tax=Chionoecetes opilio TaxID=41210 RepID=A0A8J8WL12_CHIOP|nr:hypothetical protein GWK47_026803 [Chionoecetes opilio]
MAPGDLYQQERDPKGSPSRAAEKPFPKVSLRAAPPPRLVVYNENSGAQPPSPNPHRKLYKKQPNPPKPAGFAEGVSRARQVSQRGPGGRVVGVVSSLSKPHTPPRPAVEECQDGSWPPRPDPAHPKPHPEGERPQTGVSPARGLQPQLLLATQTFPATASTHRVEGCPGRRPGGETRRADPPSSSPGIGRRRGKKRGRHSCRDGRGWASPFWLMPGLPGGGPGLLANPARPFGWGRGPCHPVEGGRYFRALPQKPGTHQTRPISLSAARLKTQRMVLSPKCVAVGALPPSRVFGFTPRRGAKAYPPPPCPTQAQKLRA